MYYVIIQDEELKNDFITKFYGELTKEDFGNGLEECICVDQDNFFELVDYYLFKGHSITINE